MTPALSVARPRARALAGGLLALASLLLIPGTAGAHCDTLDGPVVVEARASLDKGDVTPVLKWINADDEEQIRAAFKHAQSVRALGPEAKELADSYFLETLVRLHRESEGEPYTGLKPAGLDQGPVIPAADRALETGDLVPLYEILTAALHEELHRKFEAARATRAHKPDDVAAGRREVAAYVEYVHYAVGVHAASAGGGHGEGEGASRSADSHGHSAVVKTGGAGCGHAAPDHAKGH